MFCMQYKKGLDAGTLALKEGAIIKVQVRITPTLHHTCTAPVQWRDGLGVDRLFP